MTSADTHHAPYPAPGLAILIHPVQVACPQWPATTTTHVNAVQVAFCGACVRDGPRSHCLPLAACLCRCCQPASCGCVPLALPFVATSQASSHVTLVTSHRLSVLWTHDHPLRGAGAGAAVHTAGHRRHAACQRCREDEVGLAVLRGIGALRWTVHWRYLLHRHPGEASCRGLVCGRTCAGRTSNLPPRAPYHSTLYGGL